jgi:hypothetical protein
MLGGVLLCRSVIECLLDPAFKTLYYQKKKKEGGAKCKVF